MAKLCRAKPKYKKWTPVLSSDGYMMPPPRTYKKRSINMPFKRGDVVVRTFYDYDGVKHGNRYTVDEMEHPFITLKEIPSKWYAAKHFKLLIGAR